MFYQYRYWEKMQLRMNVYEEIYQFGSLFSLHFDKKNLVNLMMFQKKMSKTDRIEPLLLIGKWI